MIPNWLNLSKDDLKDKFSKFFKHVPSRGGHREESHTLTDLEMGERELQARNWKSMYTTLHGRKSVGGTTTLSDSSAMFIEVTPPRRPLSPSQEIRQRAVQPIRCRGGAAVAARQV